MFNAYDLLDEENLEKYSNEELEEIIKLCDKYENLEGIAQKAVKVNINSLYGILGNAHFRYYDIRNAFAITSSGKLVILWVERKINEYLNAKLKTNNVKYAIYIDTDGIYVNFEGVVNKLVESRPEITKQEIVDFLDNYAKKAVEPYLEESFNELAEYMNVYEQKMSMDREVIAERGFWTAKKRYALKVWDNEGKRYVDKETGLPMSKSKIIGLETRKSGTPKFVSENLESIIEIILNENEKAVQEFFSSAEEDFNNYGYLSLCNVKSVNNIEGYMDENMQPIKGAPHQVKAALAYNREATKHKLPLINSGEKVMIINLKQPNPLRVEELAIPSGSKIPVEFGDIEKYIDKEVLFNKHFIKPLESISDAIKWKYKKISNLSDLFKRKG